MQRPSGEEEDNDILQEPQTDANKEPLAMVNGAQLIYDTFPQRLREVAVGLILLRAEVADDDIDDAVTCSPTLTTLNILGRSENKVGASVPDAWMPQTADRR